MAADHVNCFPLLELQFASGTDFLCGLDHDVTYNGNTYLALGGSVAIDRIAETATQTEGLRLSIAGSPSANIALALGEKVQGRLAIVRLAMIDSGGALVVDENMWTGLMDVFTLQDDPNNCAVVITAEHMLAVWDRPRTIRYTDAQQQILFPGDFGLQYVEEMADANIVWPGKEFFQV